MNKQKTVVLVADIDEYVNFQKRFLMLGAKEVKSAFKLSHQLETEKQIITSVCFGIGKVNAATAAAYFAAQGYNFFLNYGYSGGVSGVKKGDIVIADSFLEHDFDLTAIGYAPCEKPGQQYIYNTDEKVIEYCKKKFPFVYFGRAVCGDSFISDDEKRNYLKQEFSAVSCDMETAAIASVANLFGIPLLAIREISDDAGNDANDLYLSTIKNQKECMIDVVFDCISQSI